MNTIMKNKYETIDRVIEYGIYLYLFFMFLAKGEAIRNILIFGNFGLWLIVLRQRDNLYILKSPVAKLLYIFLGTAVISVIFSIDPYYSLSAFKNQPLKCALLFPVMATMLNDEVKLQRVAYVCFFAMMLLVSAGYYSFIVGDTPYLRPLTTIAYAYYTRFAGYINTLLPIAFVLFMVCHRTGVKVLYGVVFIITFVALILTTSRGGYIAFGGIALVWFLYLSRKKGYHLKKIGALLIALILIIGAFAYVYSPDVRSRIDSWSTDFYTFNLRTELWDAVWHGFLQRPVAGWGYGGSIYHMEEPYIDTPYTPPERGEHNMFLTVLFHQGLIGFIPFLLLIITATVTFWKAAYRCSGIRSYMLVACASIFLGNYILHAQLESMFKLQFYAVVLGLGMAAKGINEDSDN